MEKDCCSPCDIQLYKEDTKDDPDFTRFYRVHPDVTQTSPIWIVARQKPCMVDKCYDVAKLIAYPSVTDVPVLCEYCGQFYSDTIIHFTTNCSYCTIDQNTFWDIISNDFSVSISAGLYNLDDQAFVDVILGGPRHCITDKKTHVHFMTVAINFLAKVMKKVELFIEP